MKRYVLFQEDGSYTEHEAVPEPDGLGNYLCWITLTGNQWYSVQIERRSPILEWNRIDVDEVPGGIRLYAMLIL